MKRIDCPACDATGLTELEYAEHIATEHDILIDQPDRRVGS